jgi:hypothetical protein
MRNLRRGHYELGIDTLPGLTVAAAFDEQEQSEICPPLAPGSVSV